MTADPTIPRRQLGLGAAALAATPASAQTGAQTGGAPAIQKLPGLGLAYWDTGGSGPAVVLVHPGTGSHAIWEYQTPELVQAGFRVIAYSRRGYLDSDTGPENDTGSGAADLKALVDHLGLEKFHAVGSAAGAIVVMDFAQSFPERLHSQVLACTIMGITDPAYVALSRGLRPEGFDRMPADFRELGPSYRAANPQGTRRWLDLEHRAIPGRRVSQRALNQVTWASLRTVAVRTLIIGGDADLWSPPFVTRLFAAAIPRSESVVIPESGHSAYWEQPRAFNAAVIAFLRKTG